MSFSIQYWDSFDKKPQSTKVPTNGIYISDVNLKESTSIYNPVFILQESVNTASHVYFKWDQRYYYVNDVIHTSNFIREYHCTLDPYATFSTKLASYKGLTSRQTLTKVTYQDSMLYDEFAGMKQEKYTKDLEFDFLNRSGYAEDPKSLTYVVQFFTKTQSSTLTSWNGGFTTLLMQQANLAKLIATLFESPYSIWNSISEEAPADYLKTNVTPSSFIKSVKMYPIPFSKFATYGSQKDYKIGWTTITATGIDLNDLMSLNKGLAPLLLYNGTVNMPIISDGSATYSKGENLPYYVFNSNNMAVDLYTGIWGTISVPPEFIYTPGLSTSAQQCEAGGLDYQLDYEVYIDFYSSSSTLRLKHDDAIISETVSSNLAIDIPVQEFSTTAGANAYKSMGALDRYNQQTAGDSTAQGYQSRTDNVSKAISIGNVITGAIGYVKAAATNNQATVSNISGVGGILPPTRMYATVTYHLPDIYPATYNAVMGRPTHGVKQAVSGFNQFASADIAFTGTQTEHQMLANILLNGYYNE